MVNNTCLMIQLRQTNSSAEMQSLTRICVCSVRSFKELLVGTRKSAESQRCRCCRENMHTHSTITIVHTAWWKVCYRLIRKWPTVEWLLTVTIGRWNCTGRSGTTSGLSSVNEEFSTVSGQGWTFFASICFSKKLSLDSTLISLLVKPSIAHWRSWLLLGFDGQSTQPV